MKCAIFLSFSTSKGCFKFKNTNVDKSEVGVEILNINYIIDIQQVANLGSLRTVHINHTSHNIRIRSLPQQFKDYENGKQLNYI